MAAHDPVRAERFVVDAMLGRLAHWLRAMGYDTLYLGAAPDAELLALAQAEGRVLLTRDAALARAAGAAGRWVRAERLEAQLAEVVQALGLAPAPDAWLSRCLECNALLEPRTAEAVRHAVPPRVLANAAEFWGCPGCGRVYWAGTHAAEMLARIAALVGRGPQADGGSR